MQHAVSHLPGRGSMMVGEPSLTNSPSPVPLHTRAQLPIAIISHLGTSTQQSQIAPVGGGGISIIAPAPVAPQSLATVGGASSPNRVTSQSVSTMPLAKSKSRPQLTTSVSHTTLGTGNGEHLPGNVNG
jgi:hypothetical protein